MTALAQPAVQGQVAVDGVDAITAGTVWRTEHQAIVEAIAAQDPAPLAGRRAPPAASGPSLLTTQPGRTANRATTRRKSRSPGSPGPGPLQRRRSISRNLT